MTELLLLLTPGEFLILCDFVLVSSEEGLEMEEVGGIGCN